MKAQSYYCKWLITLGLVCLFISPGFAQNYGLGFASHEVIADKRTSLNLFPGDDFQGRQTFDLNFEMSFLPNKADYFGYICRIITGSHNIDLVYNNRLILKGASIHNRFRLVAGESYANIDFVIPPQQLYNSWNKVSLKFDCINHTVIVIVNGRDVGQQYINFVHTGHYKMFFGICDNPDFKTSDCSAFRLRNVSIFEDNTKHFSWPLDEESGDVAHEALSGQSAVVNNPHWMKEDHQHWLLENNIHLDGITSAAFDQVNNRLYLIGTNTLHQISVVDYSDKVITYKTSFNLLPSNESIFVPFKHKLYNYYIDNEHQQLEHYDTLTNQWSVSSSLMPLIDYWQTNSFSCERDTSIYVVGGYGRMTYKNEVFRCSLSNSKWEKIITKGDKFCPRYLSACGTTNHGDIAYFLGGYGSTTGEQMLNARNMYDLIRFDVKNRTFKKIFDLKVPINGFVCSNNMLIDERSKTYAVLVYSNQKFNTNFRLLTGSLTNPNYQLLGDPVPFDFYDTHSFLKLFYNTKDKQYIAVSMYRAPEHDHDSFIQVYSLSGPAENRTVSATQTNYLATIIYVLIGLICFTLAGYLWRFRKRMSIPHGKETEKTSSVAHVPPMLQPVLTGEDEENGLSAVCGSAIYLFGNLKITDKNGKDITGNFTALVKELFLVIIIYSLRSKSGISPDKLIELLWADKTDESARNNRSANLSKLKTLLNFLDHIHLSKDTGNWRTEIDFQKVHVDLHEFLAILEHKKRITKDQIAELCSITTRGSFLYGVDYPWLDQIKANIANDAIDIYLNYLEHIKVEHEPDFAIEIADAIFVFDPVNEEAMMIKCRALFILGKHSLAKSTYENFSKEFKDLYGEQFKSDFHAIVSV